MISQEQQEPDAQDRPDKQSGGHRKSLSGKELWKDASNKIRIASVLGTFRTLRFMCEDCYIEADQLTDIQYLGEGAFAKVSKCRYDAPWGAMNVAVKRLKPKVFACEEDVKNFILEGRLCLKLRHKNIVETLGLGSNDKLAGNNLSGDLDSLRTESAQHQWYIVQELMHHGALKAKVMEQAASPSTTVYTSLQALQWIHQVAQGMTYLHNANPKVIHRDLKLDNVLITNDCDGILVAKIADFGLSALVPPTTKRPESGQESGSELETGASKLEKSVSVETFYQLNPATGSLLNMAPEVLGGSPYNEKADVYSLAIIMYELFQKSLMISFVPSLGTAVDVEIYAYNIMGGQRPTIPTSWPTDLQALIKDCWAQEPGSRPSMRKVVDRIQLMMDQEYWNDTDFDVGEKHSRSTSDELISDSSASPAQSGTSTEEHELKNMMGGQDNEQWRPLGCLSFFRKIISPTHKNLLYNE